MKNKINNSEIKHVESKFITPIVCFEFTAI
jgi:hypothetical protein